MAKSAGQLKPGIKQVEGYLKKDKARLARHKRDLTVLRKAKAPAHVINDKKQWLKNAKDSIEEWQRDLKLMKRQLKLANARQRAAGFRV